MINEARPMAQGGYECRVVNCARCGGLHGNVQFHAFKRPPASTQWDWAPTHWGTCPDTGEPILFQTRKAKQPAPVECKAPDVHPSWCGCPEAR